MTAALTSCPRCAVTVAPGDRFCERCGVVLAEIRRAAVPRPVRSTAGGAGLCPDCGNSSYLDSYCTTCGNRLMGPDREEAWVGDVMLVTDRGHEHPANEDAAAAGILAGRTPVTAIAVCDGVSTSSAAHLAAAAAAGSGVDAMLTALAAGRTAAQAVLAGLAAAADAAAATGAGADRSMAPSCTYTAATVAPIAGGGADITVGNVGDSRAYWIPETPSAAKQLTVDDSLAQELLSAGADAGSKDVRDGTHVLTRWLGADAEPVPWSESAVASIAVTGPGWLLICTDGLWNYLPDPAMIATLCAGLDSAGAARALVAFALNAGGHDNITVAVTPIGGPDGID